MLVAESETGERISLVESWQKDELVNIREKEKFQCLVCKNSVQLKLGEQKRYHFAHKRKAECLLELENESAYHMEGKIKLFHWLKAQHIPVEIEKYLPEIKQRPDLLFTYKEKIIAIEYQCSTISPELFQKRTYSYQNAGIQVIWILGGKCLKRKNSHTFHITPFQELFTTNFHKYEIISFCPITDSFLILGSSMYSFSAQSVISQLHVTSLVDTTFPQLFKKYNPLIYSIHREWLMKKKKWRLYPHNQDNSLRLFLEQVYKLGIKHIPSEIGVPTPSIYSIRTSPIIWQGYLVISILFPLKIGKIVTLNSLCKYMNYLYKKEIISFRQLFFMNNQYTFIVEEYMEFLIQRKLFKRIDENTFGKIEQFNCPNTIEEALALDYETTLLALRM